MPILAVVAILFAVAADANADANTIVYTKDSTVGIDGNFGFYKPYVLVDGERFPLSPESADAACARMGYEYAVSSTKTTAMWGAYQVYHLNGDGTLSGPVESPAKLKYLRCYSYAAMRSQIESGYVEYPFDWPNF